MATQELIPSGVSKVRRRNNQKNSFGLMPGPEYTCPFATVGKGGCMEMKAGGKRPTCYVFKAFRNKCVKPVLEHNTNLLMSANQAGMVKLLDAEFTRFETAERKAPEPWMYYRLHWSGDIFSMRYAKALAKAISMHPDITFWCYTRSFRYVEPLVGLDNLRLYLSLDPMNRDAGLEVYEKYRDKGLLVSYLSKSDEHIVDRKVDCPADTGKLGIEGACAKCGICPNSRFNVWFRTK